MKKFWAEFKKFITRGNVVDMAVGVTVATAFTAIVTAFTKGFISPILALLTSDANLAEAKWVIRPELTELIDGESVVTRAEVAIMWGGFLQAVVDFLLIAFILFLMMRIAHRVAARASKLTNEIKTMAGINDEAIAAEKAKAEAEAKAKAEAEEKARAEAEAARIEAEKKEREAREEAERLRRELELLTEIRDLLKKNA